MTLEARRTLGSALPVAAVIAALCVPGAAQAGAALDQAPVLMAQGAQAAGGKDSGGGTGSGQFKHPESGATSPSGSSAVGPGDAQGQSRDASPAGAATSDGKSQGSKGGASKGSRSGSDTQDSGGKGSTGTDGGRKGSAGNVDHGPGHRSPDTRPGG
jgi:hypothetical protein